MNKFNEWIDYLNTLGYKTYWKVLNATDYGSAQNRERVFAVSILENELKKDFVFPEKIKHNKTLNSVIHNLENDKWLNVMNEYKISDFKKTKQNIVKAKILNYSTFNSEAQIYQATNYGATLTASGANSRLKLYLPEENKVKIINALEAYLYTDFDYQDWQKVNSTQLISSQKMIFCCGNSICVKVLEALFKEIIKHLN
ncbi:DNA cytosine methyltransferase [Mycoplasma sp. 1573]